MCRLCSLHTSHRKMVSLVTRLFTLFVLGCRNFAVSTILFIDEQMADYKHVAKCRRVWDISTFVSGIEGMILQFCKEYVVLLFCPVILCA